MSPEAAALALSGPRKAAALLITLGTEASAKLLARLPPEALDRVALELMRMPAVDSATRDAILEEAYAGLFAHAGVLPGGENYALELFGQAFGSGKARELLERVHQAQQIIPFDFMRDIDPMQAAGLLSRRAPPDDRHRPGPPRSPRRGQDPDPVRAADPGRGRQAHRPDRADHARKRSRSSRRGSAASCPPS